MPQDSIVEVSTTAAESTAKKTSGSEATARVTSPVDVMFFARSPLFSRPATPIASVTTLGTVPENRQWAP